MLKRKITVMMLLATLVFSWHITDTCAGEKSRSSAVSDLTAEANCPPPVFMFGSVVVNDHNHSVTISQQTMPISLNESLNIDDPMQGFNRVMFAGNDFLITWALRPISNVYGYIIPLYFRERIGHIYNNLQMPRKVLSNLCRGRWNDSGIEFYRFLINTTVGIAGAYDPAMQWWNITPRPSDFGATFADWGFEPGAYIVLPFLGSTSVRNGTGLIFDTASDPLFWISWFLLPFPVSIGVNGGLRVNGASLYLDEYERLRNSSIDPYMTMRNFWYIRRVYDINR